MKSTRSFLFCLFLFNYYFLPAQWVKTNGPEGISISEFFKDGTTLYTGTQAQGVYKSTDNGLTWTFSGLPNFWVDCFANDDTYLYAGIFGEGVYRSANNGQTWQPANIGISSEAVYSLLVTPTYLFAGTVGNGLFKSNDHGTTWTNANGGALNSSFIFSMVYQDGRLMVEADNYIFFSYDNGNTWDVDQGPTAFYTIHDFYQKGDTILASSVNTLFRSLDGGITWSDPYYIDDYTSDFDRIGNTVYIGTGFGVYSSTNWGQTWTHIIPTNLRSGSSTFVIGGNNFLMGREEIGIAISSNAGQAWSEISLSQFSRASAIDDCMIIDNGTLYSGTHGNGVFSSPDQGNTWTKIGTNNLLDTLSSEIIFSMLHPAPNIILAGACGKGLYRSADNGATWTHITNGLPPQTGTTQTCVRALDKAGNNCLAALQDGIYYSTDNGLTWHATNMAGSNVLQAGGFAVRNNIVCAGLINFPSPPTGVYRSTDFGITWSFVVGLPDVDQFATGGGSTMYCGELFTSYVSHDDGFTWLSLPIGAAFTILAWDEYAFIGNNDGIFFSEDSGDTWSAVNEGMDPYPNNAVQGLTRDDNYIYAGMYRDAIWKRPLSDFGFDPPPCSMVVQNTSDTGPGSLREVIGCAATGSTIIFNPVLLDQTITLTSGEINVDKNLTITGPGLDHLKISGNNNSRIFHLMASKILIIQGLNLENSNASTNGGAIYNEGNLTLANVVLKNNKQNGMPKSLTLAPASQLKLIGNVQVKN